MSAVCEPEKQVSKERKKKMIVADNFTHAEGSLNCMVLTKFSIERGLDDLALISSVAFVWRDVENGHFLYLIEYCP